MVGAVDQPASSGQELLEVAQLDVGELGLIEDDGVLEAEDANVAHGPEGSAYVDVSAACVRCVGIPQTEVHQLHVDRDRAVDRTRHGDPVASVRALEYRANATSAAERHVGLHRDGGGMEVGAGARYDD